MKTLFKEIYLRIDGSKALISWGISAMLQQAVQVGIIDKTKFIQWLIGIFMTFGATATIHHAKKGYFSKHKGN